MEFRRILVLGALLASTAVLAQAYRWVDENGVVHYSDRYREGAEEVSLPESGRSSRPAPRPRATPDTSEREQPPASRYSSFEVTSPSAEETLWNIGGVLNVSLALTPALQPGHQIRVYFDGQPRIVEGMSFQLEEVYRGVHNLQAEILDEQGRMVIRSRTNRFYVQQNSVITAPGAARPQAAP